jgi:drug/metabolite transporter (DMT)-like permease
VSTLEWIGVIVAFIGIVLASLHVYIHRLVAGVATDDSSGMTQTAMEASIAKESWHVEMLGVVLCLLASANEVVVLLNRSKIKKYVPLMQYTAFTTVIVMLGTTLAALILERDSFNTQIFCRSTNCVFGWISQEWYWKMLLFGLIIGLVCITGFNYAIEHIPALVFSSITLIDPLVTGLLSWMAGFESVPDLGTWIGGVVVITGVALISHGERTRTHSERAGGHDPLATHDNDNDVTEEDLKNDSPTQRLEEDIEMAAIHSELNSKSTEKRLGYNFMPSQHQHQHSSVFSYGRIDSCDDGDECDDDTPPQVGLPSFRSSYSACTTNSEVTSASPDIESYPTERESFQSD